MSYRLALLCLCVVSCWLSAAENDELAEVQFNNETLYLRLCYIIGDWVKDRLLEFVITLSDTEMMNENDVLNPEFQKLLKEAIHLLLTHRHIINSSMTVLYKILVAYSGPAYYSNVDIFRTLTKLYIKFDFLENYEKNLFNPSEITVIQSIVEELYDIQSFLTANHPSDIGSPYNNNKSISSDNMSGFLIVVNSMIQDSNHPDCEIKQILLANMVTLPPEDIVSRRILQSSVAIAPNQNIKIFDIFQNMTVRLDSELVFLYQDAIMMAIIKLLYNLIVVLDESHIFKERASYFLDSINSQISSNPILFPELMVDGFELLTSIIMQEPNYDKESNHIINNKLFNSIDLYEETLFEKFLLLLFQEISFVKILNKILNNINDFKCFHESVKYRQIEHANHYKKVFETINNITGEQFESDDVCQFVFNIFLICYNELIDLKNYTIAPDLSIIIKFTFVILKCNNININLYNTFMDIAIILVNKPLKMEMHGIIKIFRVIITKLNIFGTKYCNPKTFKFLFHSTIEYDLENNIKSIEKYIITIYPTYEPKNNKKSINYLNIQFINATYVKTSNVINNYGKNVNFFWKLDMLSISEIYMDYNIFNLNLNYLYAFYDIYFKFYIAIVFYTFKTYFNESKETTENKLKTFKNNLNEFKSEYFPFELMNLVKIIKQMIEISSNQASKDTVKNIELINESISKTLIKIENKLFQNGIWFQNFDLSSQTNLTQFTSNLLKSLNKDLKRHVQLVNKLFIELMKNNK